MDKDEIFRKISWSSIIILLMLGMIFVVARSVPEQAEASDNSNPLKVMLPKQKIDTKQLVENSKLLTIINKSHPAKEDENLKLANISPNEQIRADVKPHYEALADAAKKAGFPLVVVSGYRSKAYQQEIYDKQISNYKAQGDSEKEAVQKTNEYMMKPGTSEHQTGLAIDVLDEAEYQKDPTLNPDFGNTPGGKWLAANCAKYGFIIRYPKDKEKITGINYEPWHLRYVGIDNAEKITKSGKCLEEYVNIKN